MLQTLFILNLVATSIMTGVIWMVQIVHYPFFHHVDKSNFGRSMDDHRHRISFIVVPVMLIELGTGIGLVVTDTSFSTEFLVGLILLILIWITTVLFQVPSHGKLAAGHNSKEIDKLVRFNWIRTVLWTLRLGVLLSILGRLSLANLL